MLYTLLEKLNQIDRKDHRGHHDLEMQMRLILNTLLMFMIYNNDDPSVAQEITSSQFIQIEEICMKAVRISLELAIVPIRKFLIVFFIYMRLLFGYDTRPPVVDPKCQAYYESESIKKNKHLLYLKEYIDVFLNGANTTPRFNLRTKHPVESFYKRHMTTDQPIPQVIVVGILRVLLTTCPNNQKNNGGGIELNAEWSACLDFLSANRAFFKEHGFKSKAFTKTDFYLDYVPMKERPDFVKEEDEGIEPEEVDEELEFQKMPEY